MKERHHGGRRPGAGRKPILKDSVSVTFDMERAERDRLRKIARRRGEQLAATIRRALSAYTKRYGPKE